MPAPRRKFTTYAPPGRDSPRAKANAVWALLNTPEHKLGTSHRSSSPETSG
jgi:hypothetical protein